jgi:hypothetical protein
VNQTTPGITPTALIPPVASMQEMLNMITKGASEYARVDGLFWLLWGHHGGNRYIQQMNRHGQVHMLARGALRGLLDMALTDGFNQEILQGIATAIRTLYSSISEINQAWAMFLQASPAIARQPLVQQFRGAMAFVNNWHETFRTPALQVYNAVTK